MTYAGADMYSLVVFNLGAVETEGRRTIAKLTYLLTYLLTYSLTYSMEQSPS